MPGTGYNYQHYSWALEHGACQRWLRNAPQLGQPAPDFELPALDGTPHRLSQYRGRTVVIEFGSYTCPIFCARNTAMETLAAARPDTAFLIIYTREAHPGTHTPAHRTLLDKHKAAHRLAAAETISRTLLIDTLDGPVHRQYGPVWDSVFVIDPVGRIVLRQAWNHPAAVAHALNILANGESPAAESIDMDRTESPTAFGHGLLRGGPDALLDFYTGAPPPVRELLRQSASAEVRSVISKAQQ
jgi:peroxiredoxin